MQYGICNLSIIPLRQQPTETSELVSQVLYGEVFKVLESRKSWSKIRLAFDAYEGWIDHKQYIPISQEDYKTMANATPKLAADLVEVIQDSNKHLFPMVLGSSLNGLPLLNHTYEGRTTEGQKPKSKLVETAFMYLNTPYLWGGKTPFGMDCSGFTQMVYKLNGYKLLRDASQQATQGDALSFIEESEAGDLAFFDNSEGHITHVGIIMENNYIIHAHGKVRIDRLDHSGIFNTDRNIHTHRLRVIKKIV